MKKKTNILKRIIHKCFWTRKCIVCGSYNTERFRAGIAPFLLERAFDNKKVKTDLLSCKNCLFSYFEMRPTEEQMSKLYQDYRETEYQKQRQSHEPEYTPEFNNHLGHNPEEIESRKENLSRILQETIDCSSIKTVLDYGGDKGQFIPDNLKHSDKFVYEVSGIEPIAGVKAIEDEKELKECRWDFIMCCHVLEHISYPMPFLKKVLSLMHKGSYLYIELPNEKITVENYPQNVSFKGLIKHPRVLFELMSQKYMDNNDKIISSFMHEHINFFNIKTLEKIFSNSEYKILKQESTQKINSILIEKV